MTILTAIAIVAVIITVVLISTWVSMGNQPGDPYEGPEEGGDAC